MVPAVRQMRLPDPPNCAPRPVSWRTAKRLDRAGDSGGRRRFRAERGRRAARREVGLVSSNGRSGLPHGKSGPAPCHTVRQSIDAFPCRSLRRSRRASRQSSAALSVSAPGLMVARSSRPRHSGSRSPGRQYESSRHGLAASRPRTPGSGAVRSLHRHEAFQPLWDTPHCSDATRWSNQLHSRCVIRGHALPRRGAARQPRPGRPRLRRSQVNATHRSTRRAPS